METAVTPNQPLATLLPALVHIQTHLDADLSLATVATVAGLSTFHFHRLFQTLSGETLKQYTQRLRLERAAYQLKLRDDTILEIALNHGYQNHETFSRAFKRWFGVSPRQYRRSFGRFPDSAPPGQSLNTLTEVYQLSAITIQQLNQLPLAFIRHLGPYVDVDAGRFADLQRWIDANGLYVGDNVLLGIGHDDPGITAPAQLRYDICVTVPEAFTAVGEVGYQELPAMTCATASYVGPFGPTMAQALGELFVQVAARTDVTLIGLPLVEIYRTTQINPNYALNHTDIFIPVERKRQPLQKEGETQ